MPHITLLLFLLLFACPLAAAEPLEFFSPDERWGCRVHPLPDTRAVELGITLDGQKRGRNLLPASPAEIHLDNGGRYLLAIFPAGETLAVRLQEPMGSWLGDWSAADFSLPGRPSPYPWHEFDQTGFLTDNRHFQITLRRGDIYWIELATATMKRVASAGELYEMGWAH